jgi:hypothetical protein
VLYLLKTEGRAGLVEMQAIAGSIVLSHGSGGKSGFLLVSDTTD